jgi:hypothetical protein
MTIPGFTADASLAKTEQPYILATATPAKTGSVLPQYHIQPPHCGCHPIGDSGGIICTCV